MELQKAYAKINLGIRILTRRTDGYHDIETVFHRIDLYDELRFSESTSMLFESDSNELPVNDENLCVRAASFLKKESGVSHGAKIGLTKRIPIGAGLGGGSSDAAATLLGLNRLWKLGLSADDLASIGLRLGADVTYFLKEGSALATGRGELLEYFSLSIPYWIVTVFPGIHVSTSWAYARIAERKPRDRSVSATTSHLKENLPQILSDPSELQNLIRNDFEEVVFREFPQIGIVKEMFMSAGAVFAQMTGSGSALYGFFRDEASARRGANQFPAGMRSFITLPHFQP